ncbi:unnamed protein product [Oikopleura dioica]|uniref:Cytochrome c oxidase subunit 4 n=1 Tax=Oikopleura dioica TaxID=34765 RepID=E4Z267_OIKDI|nr:unnamed protein product [Oikopleura dioica]
MLKIGSRRLLSVGLARAQTAGVISHGNVSGDEVFIVGQNDPRRNQENPDFNLHFYETLHVPFPLRPFQIGRPGSELAAVRAKESGDWKDLSGAEKEALYRGAFMQPITEQQQGTDMWKGIIGAMMLVMGSISCLTYELHTDVSGFKPNQAGFWYFWQPGWAQVRKNIAAENIFLEYTGSFNQRDYKHWDYVNHVWKNPQATRIDGAD